MPHYRAGVADYVMTASTGQRELLFVEGWGCSGSGMLIIEQPKRATFEESTLALKKNYKVRYKVPAKSLLEQSMQLVRGRSCHVESLVILSTVVTRFQFRQFDVVKWAPFVHDGAMYFAPYKIAAASPADVLILRKDHQSVRHIATKVCEASVINELMNQELH